MRVLSSEVVILLFLCYRVLIYALGLFRVSGFGQGNPGLMFKILVWGSGAASHPLQ